MRRYVLFALMACLAVGSLLCLAPAPCQAEVGKAGEIGNIYARGVAWPWERTALTAKKSGLEFWTFVDRTMASLSKDYGCNAIWIVNISMDDAARMCDLGEKYGLKILPNINPILRLAYEGFTGIDSVTAAAQEAARVLGGKKALGAYVLRDESRRWQTKYMELFRQALAKADPNHPSIVVTMNSDTDSYAIQTDFPIHCVDLYMFGAERSPNLPNTPSASQNAYRGFLQTLGSTARRYGKELWVMPQVYGEFWGPWWYDENMQVVIEPGTYYHWRMPTVAETKWQIWEGVRQGCKGVLFFVLFPGGNEWDGKGAIPEHMAKAASSAKTRNWPLTGKQIRTGDGEALLYSNGKPTVQMTAMGKEFHTLAGMEKLLLKLKPADFPVAFTDNPLAVSTFADNSGARYVVVVNNDLKAEQEGKVLLLPHAVSMEDLVSGNKLQINKEGIDGPLLSSCLVKLEPGSGTVLKVGFAKDQPGILLFEEDFSIATLGVQLKNMTRQPIRQASGSGWEWIAQKETGLSSDTNGVITIGNITVPGGATAGVMTSPNTQLDVYMLVEGVFPRFESMVINSVDSEGKEKRLQADGYYLPVQIPRGTTDVRMQIADRTTVKRILIWAAPKPISK